MDESKSEKSIQTHRKKVLEILPTIPCAHTRATEISLPTTSSPIKIYRPDTHSSSYPTIIFIPGTGFIANEYVFTNMFCAHLSALSKCQVIIIRHPLAPEHPFPEGLNEIFATIKIIVSASNSSFQLDTKHTFLMGYSSGGNYACSLITMAHDHGLLFNRLILISPMLDLSRTLQDYKHLYEDKDSSISNAFIDWFLSIYLTQSDDPRDPNISPYWLGDNILKKMPPTDIFFGEFDRFRSDAEAFYKKLHTLGVDVHRHMLLNQDHSFLWRNLDMIAHISHYIGKLITL